MRGSRKFCQRVSLFDNFFLFSYLFFFFFFFWWGEVGSTYHYKRASETRRVDAGPTLNAGLKYLCFSGDPDQYCEETLYFGDFQGGPDPLRPTLSGSKHVYLCDVVALKLSKWKLMRSCCWIKPVYFSSALKVAMNFHSRYVQSTSSTTLFHQCTTTGVVSFTPVSHRTHDFSV